MTADAADGGNGTDEMVLLEFADLNGLSRGILINDSDFEDAVDDGIGFGSIIIDWMESLNDRGTIDPPTLGPNHGEIVAVPDPDSRVPIPWTDNELTKANCSLLHHGEPFSMCSRTILQQVLNRFDSHGLEVNVGTELEFNVFGEWNEDRVRREGSGYLEEAAVTAGTPYHTRPLLEQSDYFSELNTAMKRMNGRLAGVHKESSPGLYEAILRYSPALRQADTIMSFRMGAREIGATHGLHPTFMPRPISEYEGNSQHYHVSLWNDDENEFVDESDTNGLSRLGYNFIGGVLAHARGLTALCASTVNSYKRLQPGLWAPIDISYGFDNKTCPVRIPQDRGSGTRVEVRIPDSYANPYLALAGILAAGLDGITSELDPGEPVTKDVFQEGADPDNQLPTTLPDALEELQSDSYLVDALSEQTVDQYCSLKQSEADRYNAAITDWEVREYVDRF
jgi:glutamine synthetase